MLRRIDMLLVDLGIVETRSKAQDLIAEGAISVEGKCVSKPSEKFPGHLKRESVFLKESKSQKYVSRAGLKMEALCGDYPLKEYIKNARCLDIGQSTGGFTDFLLKSGAGLVVGVEVGTGQIHPTLQSDPRVHVLEKTHFLRLNPDDLSGFQLPSKFDVIVWDVSFISSFQILNHISQFLKSDAIAVGLIKPQFEYLAYQSQLKSFSREDIYQKLRVDLVKMAKKFNLNELGFFESHILGRQGTQEYFVVFKKASDH